MTKPNKNQSLSRVRYNLFTERFRVAYNKLSFSHRQKAKSLFCQAHEISASTFNQKLSGYNTISEMEAEWMERFNPYPLAGHAAAN